MLEDYLCSHQTKLKVLSRKELKMLQKINLHLEATNFLYLNRYKTGKTPLI